MMRRRKLGRSGATTAEFAFTIPVVLTAIFAMTQLGILFFANAGLQNAVGETARLATLWPRRSETQLRAKLTATRFGINPAYLSTPQFTYGTANGSSYVEIRVSYRSQLNFIFFEYPLITLTQSRRAYLP